MIPLLTVAKVTLVLLATLGALLVMRRASAASRHLVIALALGASLLVPLLAGVVPAWQVLPRLTEAPGSHSLAEGETGAPLRVRGVSSNAPSPSPAAERSGAARAGATSYSEKPPAAPFDRLRGAASWLSPRLGWAWGLGAAILLGLLGVRIAAVSRRIRRAAPIRDPRWLDLLRELRRSLDIRAPIELRRESADRMPLVWGLGRTRILLPAASDGWSPDERRAVLAHELAHVARRDVPVLLVGHLACAVHWFNPLAWLLDRRLAAERELACDSRVVRLGVDPARYAELLLSIATRHRLTRSLAPVFAARSQMEGRIMHILDASRHRPALSRRLALAAIAAALVALVPLASLAWVAPDAGPLAAAAAPSPEPSPSPAPSPKPSLSPGPAPGPGSNDSDSARFRVELQRLGFVGFDQLLGGLEASSALTRAASAWALGATGDARAVEPLIDVLGDRDELVRQWAVRSLGELGDARAGEPLTGLLDDGDPEVRQWAVRSLTEIGHRPALDDLAAGLDDPDAEVRQWMARGLGEMADPRSVEPLVAHLDDADAEVRQWVVRSLGELRDPRAVDPLLERLDDPDAEVRQWIVRALGELRDPRATAALTDRLGDPDPEVAEWAARALSDLGRPREPGWIGRRRGPEPLMPGLDDPPPTPGDPEAIAGLIRSLASDEANVREWSARSLGDVGDASAVLPLVDLLDDPEHPIREWAIRSLGELRDPRSVEPLIGALRDSHPDVREFAVRSLGLLRDRRAFSPLVSGLDDEDADVREWAVRALGAWGDPQAIGPLTRLLDDPDDDVRRWTERALEALRSS